MKGIHIKKFHASVTEDAEGSSQIDEPPRKRVRVACDPCRRRKTRCDGAYPCAPCQTTSSACHYTTDPTPSETSSLRQSGLDLEPPPDESFRQNFGTIDNSGELMIDLVSSTDQGSGNLPPSSLTAGLASSSWTNRASCTAQGNVQTLSESFEPGMTEISSHQGMPTAVSEYGLDDSWAMTAIVRIYRYFELLQSELTCIIRIASFGLMAKSLHGLKMSISTMSHLRISLMNRRCHH